MIARALDDRGGARVAHGKAFTRLARRIQLATSRAIQAGIAHDHRVARDKGGFAGGRSTSFADAMPLPT